jgi:YegS/Rv2252/BmrU family lipid kinase
LVFLYAALFLFIELFFLASIFLYRYIIGMNYMFIINPHSGNGKIAENIIRLIKKFSGVSYEIAFTEYAGHAAKIAANAAKTGVNVVVAVGGDGTINEIAASLIGGKTALGIIPAGSGNGFARSLNIPLDSKEAILLLNKPNFKLIDSGTLNDKPFIGVCGVGFDALVGAEFQKFGRRGPLPYFYIGIKEYFKYQYDHFDIEIDGNVTRYKPLLITIANTSQYGNGAVIAPQADPTDGYLDLCILDKMKYYELAKNLISLFNGKINTRPFYKSVRVKSLKIYPKNGNGYYHLDGEPFKAVEKLEINILPASIKVCVPKPR